MKTQDIQVGHIYHDGKQGLREVLAISSETVRYRLLASKVEREFRPGASAQWHSLLGGESEITLQSFAAWAKAGYTPEDGAKVLLGLQAAKVKLSPGELAFMASVAKEFEGDPPGTGTEVSYDHTEGRAVSGLEKKGLLRRAVDGMVEVLPLGSALLRSMIPGQAGGTILTPAQAAHVAAAFPEAREQMAKYLKAGAEVVIARQQECGPDVLPFCIAVAADQSFWIDCSNSKEEAVARAEALGLVVTQ